jgi:ATP-dependent helicase YprA (DUF1998 family)
MKSESASLVKIYLLEDINDLRYVGQTPRRMNQRLSEHRYDKKRGSSCSSRKLNLHNVTWKILEEVPADEAYDRESYWINHYDTVNELRNQSKEQRRQYKILYQRKYRLERKLTSEFLKLLEEY